jgi:hypothetical protein
LTIFRAIFNDYVSILVIFGAIWSFSPKNSGHTSPSEFLGRFLTKGPKHSIANASWKYFIIQKIFNSFYRAICNEMPWRGGSGHPIRLRNRRPGFESLQGITFLGKAQQWCCAFLT